LPNVTCKKCGANVSDEFAYCTNCGNRLDAKGRKAPSETRQGAVVGGFVGLLYGIYTAVLDYFTVFPALASYMEQRLASEGLVNGSYFTPGTLNAILYAALVMAVVFSALLGCAFGILFIKFRGHIPGNSIIRQSLGFSLILFAISFILNLGNILDAIGTDSFPMQMGLSAFSLVAFVVLGWLFGNLLERRLKLKA
jgi:hypothetical protein